MSYDKRDHRSGTGNGSGDSIGSATSLARDATLTSRLPVQRKRARPPRPQSSTALPHADRIQALFGRHSIAGVDAHIGGPAKQASDALGAHAYATGSSVAFGHAPDLHTAAHEAAHVIQQRAGVHLKGGLGEVGDTHERHATQSPTRWCAASRPSPCSISSRCGSVIPSREC